MTLHEQDRQGYKAALETKYKLSHKLQNILDTQS